MVNWQLQLRRERQLQRGGAAAACGGDQAAVGDPGRVRQHHAPQPQRGARGHRRPRPLDRGGNEHANYRVTRMIVEKVMLTSYSQFRFSISL